LLETTRDDAGRDHARGRLLDQNGNCLAGFTQTYCIARQPRPDLEIELDTADAQSRSVELYYARFAWATRAELFRTQHLTRQPCTEKRFESPLRRYCHREGEHDDSLAADFPPPARTPHARHATGDARRAPAAFRRGSA
jgi:hypothetical protein